MCHGHRAHWGRRRFGNREDWQKRLEDYQRDLEQELADVTDILKRLREQAPASGEPQTVRI
jgi:hypothetical protein